MPDEEERLPTEEEIVRWLEEALYPPKREEARALGAKSPELPPQPPLDAVTEQHVMDLEADRRLRVRYAQRIFWLLVGQLIFMNVIFFLGGAGYLEYNERTFQIYMGGTLGEVLGIVWVIVRYLFDRPRW
ncbi:MAG: hypothetical protein ACREK5_06450 [Gemmatimonadota bacterium]